MEPLQVTYRTSLDSEIRAALVAQLVKHLLYMRGQIPCLYDELLQFVAHFQLQQRGREHDPRKRRLPRSGGIKKAVKCVEAAELLFRGQLETIFTLQVQRVALIFGSSLMSPREAVILDFDGVEEDVNDGERSFISAASSPQTEEETSLEDSQTSIPPSPPMTREKLTRLCAQKLLRALFKHSVELFSSALPATKLHIAVLADRQSTRIPGFLPKQQFKLRLPKDKRWSRTHHVEIYDDVDNRRQPQEERSQEFEAEQVETDNSSRMANGSALTSGDTNHDMMWYVLEKPIPGFSEVIDTVNRQ